MGSRRVGQMYVNYSRMKNRLSKIVNNNGKHREKSKDVVKSSVGNSVKKW